MISCDVISDESTQRQKSDETLIKLVILIIVQVECKSHVDEIKNTESQIQIVGTTHCPIKTCQYKCSVSR